MEGGSVSLAISTWTRLKFFWVRTEIFCFVDFSVHRGGKKHRERMEARKEAREAEIQEKLPKEEIAYENIPATKFQPRVLKRKVPDIPVAAEVEPSPAKKHKATK